MSIAVAAVIRTPVCLRLLQALLGLCAVLAAWPLSGAWHVAALSGSGLGAAQLVGGYALGWHGALSSAAGGVFLLALLRQRRKPQVLDISPVGQLRLAVYLEHGAAPADACGTASSLRRLLPGSTLWPSLLVLCLEDGAGRRSAVLAQRGRACPAFRQLAVACRAIAAREREE